MSLTVHPVEYVYSEYDIHNCYNYMYWPVTLEIPNFVELEIKKPDIWNTTGQLTNGRLSIALNRSPELNVFCSDLTRTNHSRILDIAYDADTELFRSRWRKDLQYYKYHSRMMNTIYHDSPGYYMPPHLDNSHIILQLIINLVDNETGTELYQFNSNEIAYTCSGKAGQGIMFFNSPGAVHGIRNITQDRYILYSQITF
mgnify:FL=1